MQVIFTIPLDLSNSPPLDHREGSSVIGLPSPRALRAHLFPGVRIGANPLIGKNSIIYSNVCIGNHFSCGDRVLVREDTVIGNSVTIQNCCCIGSGVTIADSTLLEEDVSLPHSATIGSGVVIGPGVRFLRADDIPQPVPETRPAITIGDGCIIGAGAVLYPGICIGEGAYIADRTVVTGHVPPRTFVSGSPMRCRPRND